MEKNINVADILKDKPAKTKLYSPLFGYVYLLRLSNNIVEVSHHGEPAQFFNNGRYFNYYESEPLLFPSKKMRDWSKFAWKKGDVLSCGVDNLCIFEKWYNKDYTEFEAKFVTPNYSGNTFKTEKWYKETDEAVIKQYISNIEEYNGGKLNLTTLKIEKLPEFNTDSEKQQPFAALEKEGKRWDAEKKQIVNLPKKCEFKAFDKVLARNKKGEAWEPDFYSHYDEASPFPFRCIGFSRKYCIPYNEDTKHLLGTTDDWKGGEQ